MLSRTNWLPGGEPPGQALVCSLTYIRLSHLRQANWAPADKVHSSNVGRARRFDHSIALKKTEASINPREGIVKREVTITAIALVFLLALPGPTTAQDVASSIVGVWNMTGWVRKESATGKIVKSFGEHPAGIVIYTKGGHFVTFAAGQDRKKPAQADPSDAERIGLFKTMYGFGRTYKVKGNGLLTHLDTS